MSRDKLQIQVLREKTQILGTLFVVGLFVLGGLWIGFSPKDTAAEPAIRVDMWCTGYAAGFTNVMLRAGFQAPYSNEWERLIQDCIDNVIYLDPYEVQRGISPPNPSEILWDDVAPPPDEPRCIPSLLRQC